MLRIKIMTKGLDIIVIMSVSTFKTAVILLKYDKNMSISWEMDMCISLCNLLVQIEMGAGSTPNNIQSKSFISSMHFHN
jgi:NADH:ubiquinone oxidoreductase subunit H